MEATYKFGSLNGTEERPYEYANIFALENTSGPERLVIAPSGEHVSLLCDLMRVMPEPFGILYVLTVPRGQGKAGRFQIDIPASRVETEKFPNTFKDFFENDTRHHIWIASTAASDLLVYDKHNVVYAYGQLAEFERILGDRGFAKKESVRLPSPHTHKYNGIFDQDEQGVLRYWDWKWFPLHESDD